MVRYRRAGATIYSSFTETPFFRSLLPVLVLTPSVWEERLTTRFCITLNLHDCFVAVESRNSKDGTFALVQILVGRQLVPHAGGREHPRQLRRRASHGVTGAEALIPRPERMVEAAPTFGISQSEKRTLDLITDHPMIPREHLACWLGVSEGRVSQMMRSLVNTWGLAERRGQRGDTRYTQTGLPEDPEPSVPVLS